MPTVLSYGPLFVVRLDGEQTRCTLVDSSGAARTGLSYYVDASGVAHTQDAYATLVCLREDDSPADVDPGDIEFEGRVTEVSEVIDDATSDVGVVSSVVQIAVTGGAGAAVADCGRVTVTATAGGTGAVSAHLIVTVTRNAPGNFTACYGLRVDGSDGKAHRIEIASRVHGKRVINSPLHVAVRRILLNKQVGHACMD